MPYKKPFILLLCNTHRKLQSVPKGIRQNTVYKILTHDGQQKEKTNINSKKAFILIGVTHELH